MRILTWTIVSLFTVTPLFGQDIVPPPSSDSRPLEPATENDVADQLEQVRGSLQQLTRDKHAELQQEIDELSAVSESLAAEIREKSQGSEADEAAVTPLRNQLRNTILSITTLRHELRLAELAELVRETEQIKLELLAQEQQRDRLVDAQLESLLRKGSFLKRNPDVIEVHAVESSDDSNADRHRFPSADSLTASTESIKLSTTGGGDSGVPQLVDRWRLAGDEAMQREVKRQEIQAEIERAEQAIQSVEQDLQRLEKLGDAVSQHEVTTCQRNISAWNTSLRSLSRQMELLDSAEARSAHVREFYADAILARVRQADHEVMRAKSQVDAAMQRLEIAKAAFHQARATRQIVIDAQAILDRAKADLEIALEQRNVVRAAAKLVEH